MLNVITRSADVREFLNRVDPETRETLVEALVDYGNIEIHTSSRATLERPARVTAATVADGGGCFIGAPRLPVLHADRLGAHPTVDIGNHFSRPRGLERCPAGLLERRNDLKRTDTRVLGDHCVKIERAFDAESSERLHGK
jgi:hypothetical protein